MFKALLVLCVSGCLYAQLSTSLSTPLKVVASFTVIKDFVERVGGDLVEVVSIVGPNGDPHSYTPTPQDVCRFANADVVFINGLHLDNWVKKLLSASNRQEKVFEVTAGINPRLVQEEQGLVCDPHAWHDPKNAVIYVQNIREILVMLDPAHAEIYRQRAQEYIKKILKLYDYIASLYQDLPETSRVVMTAHEGFGYYGRAFNLYFYAPMGMSTEEEARPRDLARLIKTIGKYGMKVLFAESISNDKVISQIAHETGVELGEPLYSDSLSEPDGPAANYEAMLLHNTKHISAALKAI